MSKELDKLIEEIVLQEFKVGNVDILKKDKKYDKADIKKHLGLNKGDIKPDMTKDNGWLDKLIAKVKTPPDTLDIDDVEQALTSPTSHAGKMAKILSTEPNSPFYFDTADDAMTSDKIKAQSKLTPSNVNKGKGELDVDARQGLEPFGGLASMSGISTKKSSLGGAATFSPAAVDSSLIAIVDSLEGDTLIKKLEDLATLNGYYTDPNKLQSLSVGDTLRLAAATPMITALAATAKEYDATAAGFEFEKITAALCHGLQVGGGNGATDVLNVMKGNGPGFVVRYSMKLLADTGLKQSWYGPAGSSEGLWNTLNKGPLYYIFGHKSKLTTKSMTATKIKSATGSSTGMGSPSDYASIYFFCVKVELGADAKLTGPYDVGVSVMKPDGNFTTPKKIQAAELETPRSNHNDRILDTTDGKLKSVKSIKKKALWDDSFANKPFARLEAVAPGTLNDGAPAVAQRVSSAVETGTNKMLKQISMAYRLLQNMERTTQEYTAKQGTQMSKPNDQLKYVAQIGKDYASTKDSYIDIFKGVDTETGGDKQQKKFKSAAGITESKSPLDQLIEAIVKEKLSK